MQESTEEIIKKVKSLLRLSSSSNENEAREAMAYLTENIKLRR